MEIFISDIPDEGLHLEGEFPAAIFDLPPGDSIRPAGPIHYSADLYAFEEVVVLNGWLRAPFELQCGTCLEFFDYDADFPDWSTEVDIEPGQRSIDLKEIIREDFLLNLPANPRCDDGGDGHVCPKRHFISEEEAPEEKDLFEPDSRSAWGELDKWG